jgi:uncharacterized membrane protein YebE (DUF533 family)
MAMVVDPHEPAWIARWLRHAIVDADASPDNQQALTGDDSDAGLDAWIDAAPGDPAVVTRALLAYMHYIARRAGVIASAVGASAQPLPPGQRRADALRLALALAWLSGQRAAAEKIRSALTRHHQGVADGTGGGRALGSGLDDLGRALVGRIGSGVDGWLASAMLALFAEIDARGVIALYALTNDAAIDDGAIDQEAVVRAVGNVHYERGAVLEAIVGLVRADEVVDGRERRVVEAALRAAQQGSGGTRVVRDMLGRGGADLDGIATALPTRRERQRLMVLLDLAAMADGEVDARERAWIDAVDDALGASLAERLEVDAWVLGHASNAAAMTEALGRTVMVDFAHRNAERRIRGIVRAHLRSIVREVRETGDLMALMAAATQRTLTDAETTRMRRQLLDLCKTIPALAIFAAPGGAVLLPILARVLPFSLAPSSFEDEQL